MGQQEKFSRIKCFLAGLGFSVSVEDLPGKGFLNNTYIRGTHIFCQNIADETLGELLHEAGHIAVTPSMFRPLIDGDMEEVSFLSKIDEYLQEAKFRSLNPDDDPVVRGILQMDDVAATAWSYAAAVAAGVPAEIIIAGDAFGGEGSDSAASVLVGLEIGKYIGINSLAASKMTVQSAIAKALNTSPFPHMQRWLQV